MKPSDDAMKHDSEDGTKRGAGPSAGHAHVDGVEHILRASASTDFEAGRDTHAHKDDDDDLNKTSPPRDQRNIKLPVVSPPEAAEAPRRGPPAQQHGPGYDVPSVPDSYYQGHQGHQGPYYPPSYQYPGTPVKSSAQLPPKEEAGGRERQPNPQPYYPPPPYNYGYERGYYETEGGKRQRGNEEAKGRDHDEEDEEGEGYPVPPPRHPPAARAYYDRPPYNYPYYRPSVSESFDTGSDAGSKRIPRSPRRSGPPQISKAPSYPPPPSPSRYGAGASSSAASYPGTRRIHGAPHGSGSDYSYNNASIYSRGQPPPAYSSGEARYHPPRYGEDPAHPAQPAPHDYYRDPRGYPPGHPPPAYYDADYYARPGASPQEEEDHPLYRDDRRQQHPALDEKMSHSSPPRRQQISSEDTHVSSPEGRESPNKPKPSTTAQAAIAAGMTEPASAKEVDFDINDPPSLPIIPPSTRPICTQSSEITIHDVLCGRGGGTNTQIGNRRFRSLVQEFQPTYLLCRRKEKPLIARTIVLIVRNRGGRFLKKNEDDGTYHEVGDEKAEAKTSQALREGLDVRASRSSIDGKKKPNRIRKKKPTTPKKSPARRMMEDSVAGAGSPQRDGPPPPQHEGYSYPPPYGYYGYGDPYYPPPYGAGYNQAPYAAASRKRQRGPPPSEGPYEYQHYPPSSPYKSYSYQYPPEHYASHGTPPQDPVREDENPMWEMDFSPPRTTKKQEDDREH
jgi:hypothetical protein